VGGLPEMVPHEKVGYVTSQSTDEISQVLSDYYSNSREAEFKANIKIEKEKYSWDKLTAKVLKLAN
jgi:glycosyltransferase involved in cell wall biosynthesis